MNYNFCTLFDKNYLYKGLALYKSLNRNCEAFRLFILCMDDVTYDLLRKMALENVELISLRGFEDPELLKIKNTRTWAEYCWTCTASLILFLLKKYPDLEMMTYLDADLFFYNSPKPFFDEFNDNSIFITEYDYSREYKRLSIYGKYNVQFNIFRNNEEGLKALEWWRKKTIDWCYSRSRGLFLWINKNKNMQGGDQIYLNDWPTRFKEVYVLQNKKLCLGPLSASKYYIFLKDNIIYVEDTKLIFYHFHSFEINDMDKFTLADGAYKINKPSRGLIYSPYIEEIKSIIQYVAKFDPNFKYGIIRTNIKKRIRFSVKKIFYNYYRFINSISTKL